MAEKKFKFVSPGIFLEEIDNSQLPDVPAAIGPLVIGRTERGPAMRPVTVDSFSDFIEVFGNPIPGGKAGDVWRDGNYLSPTYAAYAAQAWLRNNSPCSVIRNKASASHRRRISRLGNTKPCWHQRWCVANCYRWCIWPFHIELGW